MLEAYDHAHAVFATLTYDDAHLPKDGKLQKRDVQLFLKSLRSELACVGRVRYFIAGEYGSAGGRPHYHAILYGPEALRADGVIASHWGRGFVQVGDLTPASAAYVCKYVLKDSEGFRLMSKRPGLGLGRVLEQAAKFYHSAVGRRELVETGDVLGVLRTDGKKLPLGRYLKGKLRLAAGLDDVREPPLAARVRRYATRFNLETKAQRTQRAFTARARSRIRTTL